MSNLLASVRRKAGHKFGNCEKGWYQYTHFFMPMIKCKNIKWVAFLPLSAVKWGTNAKITKKVSISTHFFFHANDQVKKYKMDHLLASVRSKVGHKCGNCEKGRYQYTHFFRLLITFDRLIGVGVSVSDYVWSRVRFPVLPPFLNVDSVWSGVHLTS